jgi:hypothetical protein
MLGIDELGKKLVMAGRLKLRPLCVYGTDEIPKGAMPSYAIDRCIAKAVYTAALYAETPPLYVDANQGQCCPGGMVWMGFNEPHPKLKYFVTVGTPDFLGGMAEHLKATPELFEEQRKRAGKVTPPGKYIVIAPCTDDIAPDKVRSVVLFAGSEQIRNLCGLGENAPKDSAYVGPTDPTGNPWLPPDLMIMGIPIALAQQMAADLDESFICRRNKIAFPGKTCYDKAINLDMAKHL